MQNSLNVLFIGDVIGRTGRDAVKQLLPQIKQAKKLSLSIINGENAAAGVGLTPKTARELFSYGIDVITSGNHFWDKKDVAEIIDAEKRLLRPANYPPGVPGHGSVIVKTSGGEKIGVINIAGRVFMPSIDCPFRKVESEVEDIRKETSLIIVDIHAEATSEKMAMGWFLDGKVSAVVGTHTHVQTTDETVLPGGTAYITDIGMTGSRNSVIGVKKELALHRFLYQLPTKFEVATGKAELCGVIIGIDPITGKANSIERIQIKQ
jgi:metallophosphoesterase (TIGR00282 family)